MRDKRTNIDWSKHEVIVTDTPEVKIWYLKKPGTMHDSIKYINCDGILAVTGDYGNWIFCREFHPDAEGGVSDGYWYEKLQISSTQNGMDFDPEETKKELKAKIHEYLEDNGKEWTEVIDEDGDTDDEVFEYYLRCIEKCDESLFDYEYYAYREFPPDLDYDDVVVYKDYKYWLKAVYDGFDEMCRRLKEENDLNNK